VTPTAIVLIVAACTVAQAFFVSAEIALSACSRTRLRQRAQASWAARSGEYLCSNPKIGLATTLLGANAAAIAAVAVAAVGVAGRGLHPMLAVAFVVPPMLVFGQVVPKTLVQHHADRMVLLMAPPLRVLAFVLRPAVLVISAFASAVTRLAQVETRQAFVTRDELAMLIESEPETDKPQITADEREMIANVFELSEYTVRELMVPLSGVTALPDDTTVGEAAVEVADKQHSRMPVYQNRVDNVVGVVHVFDILAAGADGKGKLVAELSRPATYVPESMKAIDLLVELQAEGQHLAIVVDEYGGAVGIVTVEDLLEIIVGEIDDEYDREPSPLRVEKPGVWRAAAKTSVTRVNQELDLGLPESDDYETVAGLLIERFRRIPEVGETVTSGGAVIEVVAASDRSVEVVRISKKKKA
jgi:putative hemolysin